VELCNNGLEDGYTKSTKYLINVRTLHFRWFRETCICTPTISANWNINFSHAWPEHCSSSSQHYASNIKEML